MGIQSDVQKLIVNGRITLFEIDLTNYGGEVYRVHGHLGFYDQIEDATNLKSDIIWQGQVYTAMPINISGLERRTDGKASKPKLSVGNIFNGVVGGMTAMALHYKQFAGSKIKIIDTLVKYLDAANFANGNPLAANECFVQNWKFQQMINETDVQLDFELSNPIDYDGLRLPSRDIDRICAWAKKGLYRGAECGYTGTAYYTDKDESTLDQSKDECAGWVSSCKLRFGENGVLRHGGFASSGLI